MILTRLRYVFIFVVAIALPAAVQQNPISPASQLTLEGVVTLAIANNRQIKQTALSIEQAEDALAATRTERLPQFKLYLLESELLAPVNFLFPEDDRQSTIHERIRLSLRPPRGQAHGLEYAEPFHYIPPDESGLKDYLRKHAVAL